MSALHTLLLLALSLGTMMIPVTYGSPVVARTIAVGVTYVLASLGLYMGALYGLQYGLTHGLGLSFTLAMYVAVAITAYIFGACEAAGVGTQARPARVRVPADRSRLR